MNEAVANAFLPAFAALEARASVDLDRDPRARTISFATHPIRPKRERPGYGCPHCGEGLRLDAKFVFSHLTRTATLPCCGYAPGSLELVRWLRAARLLAAGATAH